ncbi:protein-disulfide reductase DsbD family protein [Alphaproteobacteria bacterium]|nr:protein-disulfide reductase DsbD family protein [Alphaproteobacteria bacterium]
MALFAVFCIAAASPSVATALHSNWVGDPAIGEARLISSVTATGDLQTLPLALEFRLAPGWKIYWRTPGEAGLPPTIDLLADGDAVISQIKWPVPKRFNAFGFDNFGYDSAVILPLQVSGHRLGSSVQLRGQIEALVCADICVPLGGSVALTMPAGPASPTVDSRAIAQATALVPRQAGGNPLFAVERVWQAADALHMQFAAPLAIDDIFIEGIAGVAFKKPRMNGTDAVIAIETSTPLDLVGRDITATIIAGDQFAEQSFTITAPTPTPNPTAEPDISANDTGWMIFGLAWLGGLILNLMPCVLPVLAIKLGSVIESAGQQKSLVRIRFLAAAAGIVTSFILLAAALAAMRLAGAQIGWGIQFQSPLFLSVMMLLLGVFVLAMLDRLVLPVPAFAHRLTGGFGGAASPRRLVAGDFLTGMLATILATPCSAPFVGVAVGVALTGSMAELFGIFIALGVGLATPWMLIMLAPGLISALPKPGPWMVWLKRILALLLAGTALWLGSILFAITGGLMTGLLTTGVIMIIFGLSGHSRALLRPLPGLLPRLFSLVGAVLVVGLLAAPPQLLTMLGLKMAADYRQSNDDADVSVVWQDWQPAMIGPLVDSGKTVFVDVTAAWCITCKANKSLVIEQAPVAPYLRQLVDAGKLVLLQADWTRPNDDIAAFLASYQRYGIPFNIVYGPHAVDGIQLGELLTSDAVLAALNKAMTGSDNL